MYAWGIRTKYVLPSLICMFPVISSTICRIAHRIRVECLFPNLSEQLLLTIIIFFWARVDDIIGSREGVATEEPHTLCLLMKLVPSSFWKVMLHSTNHQNIQNAHWLFASMENVRHGGRPRHHLQVEKQVKLGSGNAGSR